MEWQRWHIRQYGLSGKDRWPVVSVIIIKTVRTGKFWKYWNISRKIRLWNRLIIRLQKSTDITGARSGKIEKADCSWQSTMVTRCILAEIFSHRQPVWTICEVFWQNRIRKVRTDIWQTVLMWMREAW